MSWFNRCIHRTEDEVIALIESALLTQGNDAYDDFVSIKIDDPELESVRLKCLDVALKPAADYEAVLRSCLHTLKKSQ